MGAVVLGEGDDDNLAKRFTKPDGPKSAVINDVNGSFLAEQLENWQLVNPPAGSFARKTPLPDIASHVVDNDTDRKRKIALERLKNKKPRRHSVVSTEVLKIEKKTPSVEAPKLDASVPAVVG